MPAQNIGTIDLLADTESFEEARLPISPEVDDKWRGRAITGASLLKFASTALLLTGTAAPGASLLTAGRRALYFRKDSDGDIIELHVSLDGLAWQEVSTGTDVSVQYAETDSTTDSDWHDTQGNSDAYMRFIIGETTLPSIFIGRPDDGEDGEDGEDGDHGDSARIVYIRSENEPSVPTGSYSEADGLSLDGSWQETVPTVVGGDHDSSQSFSLHSDNDRAAGIARYDGQSYVVNNAFDANPTENKFFIYDENNDYVSQHALHTDNDNPSAIAISPDGTKLFVLDFEAEQVYRYNPTTGTYVSRFNLPTGLSGSGLDVDADYIYVLNSSVKRVHVFEHNGTAHTDKNRDLPITVSHAYRGYVFHGGRDYVLNSTGSTHEIRVYKDGEHLSDEGQDLASAHTLGYGLEIDDRKLFSTDRSDDLVYVYAGAVEHPLYGSAAQINRNDETVAFSTPFLMEARDGEDGEPGADGADGKFRVTLYQNATAAPTAPNNITYTFATDALGNLGNWSQTRSGVADGERTYAIEAIVDPDTEHASVTLSFNTPVNLTATDGEDGEPGADGADGKFRVTLYRNATTAPTAPTTITYTFETGALGNVGDWSETRENVGAGESTYVIEAVVDPDTTDASVTLSFNTPVNVTTAIATAAQREESVTFQAVTTTVEYDVDSDPMLTAASNPTSIDYPSEAATADILSVATPGTAAITILKKGVYLAQMETEIIAETERPTVSVHIYNNDDAIGTDAPIARMQGAYHRDDITTAQPSLLLGKLTIAEDNTAIKVVPVSELPGLIADNADYTINAGAKLTLVRLGGTDGEDGDDGEDGEDGVDGKFRVTLYQNSTTEPTAPTNITYTFETGYYANLGDWTEERNNLGEGESTYLIEAVVDPDTTDTSVTLSFNTPVNVTTAIAVPQQREESVEFQAVSTTVEYDVDSAAMLTASSSPVDVVFPSGETTGEIFSVTTPGTAAITVLEKGVYFAQMETEIIAETERPTVSVHIYNNDDTIGTASPIAKLQGAYHREDAATAQPSLLMGKVTIAEDNTVIKVVPVSEIPGITVDNADYTINAGAKLTLVRLGGTGGDGNTEEISEGNITDGDSSTTGGVSGRRAKAAVEEFAPDADHYHITVNRTYNSAGMAGDSLNTTNHIYLYQHSGTEWVINIVEHTDLPTDYLEHLQLNTDIRLVSGNKKWRGYISHLVNTSESGAVFRVEFGAEMTGTFANNDVISISFGYAPASLQLLSDNKTIHGRGTNENKFRLKTQNELDSSDDNKLFAYDHGNNRLKPVFLERMATFWMIGQSERLPILETSLPTYANVPAANGIKAFKSATPDETHNGGIGTATTGNLNSESDADVSPNIAHSFIQVPAGMYHIKIKFRGNQDADGRATVSVRKIASGTDDIVAIDSPGYTQPFQDGDIIAPYAGTNYSEEEKYVSITATDKFYVRLSRFEGGGNALVGYVQFIRIDI